MVRRIRSIASSMSNGFFRAGRATAFRVLVAVMRRTARKFGAGASV
jgi:hypothetical protein